MIINKADPKLDNLGIRFVNSIKKGVRMMIEDILDLHWFFWTVMLTLAVLLAVNSLVNWQFIISGKKSEMLGPWIWQSKNGWNFATVMSVVSVISVVTGVVCVVLLMNRKVTNFFWGAFNVCLIGLSAISTNTWLNFQNMFFYIFPINVYSYFHWKKELGEFKGESRDIKPGKLDKFQWVMLAYVWALLTIFLYFESAGLSYFFDKGGVQTGTSAITRRIFDAISTSIFICAQTLALFKKREQYALWLLSDVFLILLWGPWKFVHDGQWDFSTFNLMFMYLLYFGTAINGLILWFLPHLKLYRSHHHHQIKETVN
ncbi:nicotinamide riboside transporter PnuC [Mycoplasma sp. SG1]|uniref:nicotinamide riboside transporter PnuC n=1 Tax=Mycoplasma sp. SG1 TaxID=2810348 RepID=UPI002024FFE1|nr:nicotinamide riboside transporter PnuC [Mycoplasma sp. SG1]URM53199.1 nicotinamide riboside transporter PnuC [Mycoplasma sp. SG1]